MKQGIIMEQHPDYTIIMTKDGEFFKAKRITDREIGEEVYYEPYVEEKKRIYFIRKTPVKMLAIACVLLLVMLPVYFFTDNQQTLAYVNIDINPSVELEIDEQLKVYTIRSLNDDADILVKGLTNINNMSIEEAIMMIMKECEEQGIKNADKNMLIGVSYHPDTKTRQMTPVKERLNLVMNEQSDWSVTSYNVPAQVREIATEQKTSVNRVMANKILEKDEAIIKEFEHHNSEQTNKKEFITSFYSNQLKHNRLSPGQKKTNNKNNEVSQDESELHRQLKEKKKTNDKIEDKGRLTGEKNATTENRKQSKGNPEAAKRQQLIKKKYENPGEIKENDQSRGYKGKKGQGEREAGKHHHYEKKKNENPGYKKHINENGNKKSQSHPQHQDVQKVHDDHKSNNSKHDKNNRGNKERNIDKGSPNKHKHKDNEKDHH